MPDYPDFEKLSDEELEKYNQDLQAARTAIGDEQEALVAVRNRRSAEAQATRILEGMAPGDLDVLVKAAAAKLSAGAENPVAEEDEE